MVDFTIGRSAIATVNLVIPQGTDHEYELRYLTKASPEAEPEPVDLTGWTARAQVRRRPNDRDMGDLWLTLTSPSGGIVLEADGTIRLKISKAATVGEAWNTRDRGVWDLELTNAAGKVIRFVEGAVKVSHDVTRDA